MVRSVYLAARQHLAALLDEVTEQRETIIL